MFECRQLLEILVQYEKCISFSIPLVRYGFVDSNLGSITLSIVDVIKQVAVSMGGDREGERVAGVDELKDKKEPLVGKGAYCIWM